MIVSFLSVVGAALLVVADQLIKQWANAVLQPVGAITLLPGIVELRYYLNDGMAFSMLAGKQTLLIVMTSIMLVCVLALLLLRKMNPWERVSWMLILGGGVGNLIDRVLNGEVVDYINVLFMNFAVFNFADICITTGVIMLMLWVVYDSIKRDKEEKAAAQQKQNENADGTT
ncbi:signal peptidase II [uncultured Subdoligranulum sp.]|uniref:signal peptidase II n=1 Tax=uncultured Subdoligranulum sp. TaxID=512298 RepID=UPI0025FC7E6D|nr:signal peptidase II [uncultured Subdoligranulum sp.]